MLARHSKKNLKFFVRNKTTQKNIQLRPAEFSSTRRNTRLILFLDRDEFSVFSGVCFVWVRRTLRTRVDRD